MNVALGVLMQIAVSVQAPDTIVARAPVAVLIRATVSGNTAPVLSVPSVSGAAMELQADVTRLGGGYGQAIATRETRYVLRAAVPGTVVIGPVTATLGTQQSVSTQKTIVVQPPPTNAVPSIVSRATLSRERLVNFQAISSPDTVWVGQQVTLQVAVFIDDELRSRLQRNPEYVAPSVEGAVAYDLPVNNEALPGREFEGARYRPFVFARALFPLRAGRMTIPGARLGYSVSSGRRVFGREERQTATTESGSVMVRELPTDGRPAAFAGAVGEYTMSARLEQPQGRVGDAVQLSIRVEGDGNIKLLPAPVVSIDGITVSDAGEAIAVDSSDLRVRGSKTFRFLLTPEREGELALGTVTYDVFSPIRGEYQRLEAALGTLRVSAGTLIATDADDARQPALPLQPWRESDVTDITDTWWYRSLALLLGVPWLALLLRRAIRRTGWTLRRRAPAPGSATTVSDAASLRRRYLHDLAPLIGARADEPMSAAEAVRLLRRSGVTPDAAQAAGALLSRLDEMTFGASEMSTSLVSTKQLAVEMDSLVAQLSAESAPESRGRLRALASKVVMLAALPVLLGGQSARDSAARDAYGAGQYDAAAAAYARLAQASPMNAGVWANLGAAHWMRADTAGAILSWQRSARLNPRGNPATAMLRQHGPESDLRTMVLPIAPNAAWLMLLIVTVLLSIGGAVWHAGNRRITNQALAAATVLVASCAALAALTQRMQDADDLVVIRRPVAMREEPVLAGETRARARGGELAVVQEIRGSWRRVTVAEGRAGWVESDALRSLAIGDGVDVAAAEARIATENAVP